uniref:Uncharacterized protein n=1 Tax=Arundo donax TaxID=35708 RepID=A0A0A8Z9J7_ARUDO
MFFFLSCFFGFFCFVDLRCFKSWIDDATDICVIFLQPLRC